MQAKNVISKLDPVGHDKARLGDVEVQFRYLIRQVGGRYRFLVVLAKDHPIPMAGIHRRGGIEPIHDAAPYLGCLLDEFRRLGEASPPDFEAALEKDGD